ncbi:MAG: small subunit ribosomal protein S15 [Alteromonas naphthalenivorans]|jgi:small subunit ribosomal protein S15
MIVEPIVRVIMNDIKKHDKDTGSAQVQIVNLTNDISRLSQHTKANKKDHSSYRSVLKKVATRKRFLKYLKRTDIEMYKKVLAAVGLKK